MPVDSCVAVPRRATPRPALPGPTLPATLCLDRNLEGCNRLVNLMLQFEQRFVHSFILQVHKPNTQTIRKLPSQQEITDARR